MRIKAITGNPITIDGPHKINRTPDTICKAIVLAITLSMAACKPSPTPSPVGLTTHNGAAEQALQKMSSRDQPTHENADPKTKGLEIVIDGFSDNAGTCQIAIYDSSATFNQFDKAIILHSVPIDGNSTARFQFDFDAQHPAVSNYAIAVYHDRNSNGTLDKNGFGIPTEEYGFSNNPASLFGPPSYRATQIDLSQSPRERDSNLQPISIHLKKLP